MINRRFTKKLTTVSLAGILTVSMSVAAFAGPGGGPGGPGGGNRGGGDGGSSEATAIDVENQTFNYSGNTYSLATGELLSNLTQNTGSSNTQQPPAPPAMGQQQRMAPPAQLQEGEEPPEKPEGDLAPEKPEGDLAPEKPEGAEELMEPPVDEDGNAIAPPEKPEGEEGEGFNPRGMMPAMIDTDALSEAIAAIEDEDTSASLSELLSAYTAAMDAEKAALDAEDTDEETLSSLREAAAEARTALLDALKEADIDIADYSNAENMPERPEGEEELMEPPVDEDGNVIAPPEKPEGDLAPAKPKGDEAPEKPDSDEDETSATGAVGIINRARTALQNMASSIGSWFGGLFK
ncbi:MAG: hypothetical protein J6O71_01805 [Lachnospiraceae bacterium]|nr:hypothetical protein [Lachnospiraceae bacterium]